jgi:DNA modification methylase
LANVNYREDFRNFFPDLTVEWRDVKRICPNSRNPRKHSAKHLAQIGASMREFGVLVPILIGPDGKIIAGNGRYLAAVDSGFVTVPVIVVSHLSDAQRRAFILAENRLAELGEWDESILKIELQELEGADLDFDIDVTGFDSLDRDEIILGDAPTNPDDDVVDAPEVPVVSKLGDIWVLGPNRLLCGSALDRDAYERLMQGELAQMMFTDPPYNIRVANISGKGRKQHDEFVMGSGEMDDAEYTGFLHKMMICAITFSEPTAVHFLTIDWRHIWHLITAGNLCYGALKNICVWVKDNAGMGSFYRSQHEEIVVFTVGKSGHINNFGLGVRGRHRSNVWSYPSLNSFQRGREEALAMHPTVKPIAMVVDAIRDCSNRSGIILDPFAGSGTTLMACEKTNRIARLIELDPKYVDVIVRRWQKATGQKALLEATGETFDDLAGAAERQSAGERSALVALPKPPVRQTPRKEGRDE